MWRSVDSDTCISLLMCNFLGMFKDIAIVRKIHGMESLTDSPT